jgi:hypothetical protein
MKHELIQTENYLLIVDDLEIRIGDYRYNIQRGYVVLVDDEPTYYNRRSDMFKKIIAHLPINGAPVLEGVDLLPPIEGEVGELANIFSNGFQLYLSLYMVGALREGFVSGYNTAKEKYKYTEEDLRKAIDMARMNYDEEGFTINAFTEYEIIKSLQQTKMPIGFECGMEICENNDVVFEDGSFNKSPYRLENKKIKNSQGQTVWVGKYIFNN